MILITHLFIFWCLSTGYFTEGSLYVQFHSIPNKRAITIAEVLLNNADSYIEDDMEAVYREGNKHLQKLVVLDRKNPKVEAFVQRVMTLIEKSSKPKVPPGNNHRKRCHRTFGSIYNAKYQRLQCKKEHKVLQNPSINFVIPVRDKVFFDATRHGFRQYTSDAVRRFVDFDYVNPPLNTNKEDKNRIKGNTRDRPYLDRSPDLRFGTNSESSRSSESLLSPSGRIAKRFEVVNNRNQMIISGNKKTEVDDASDSDSGEEPFRTEKKNVNDASENDSDEKPTREQNRPETGSEDASDSEEQPLRKDKKRKTQLNSESERNDSESDKDEWRNKDNEDDSSNENKYNSNNFDEFKPKQKRNKERKENSFSNYLYMQGPGRLVKPVGEDEGRRMRDPNYFLPKDRYWSNAEIKHLGYYWFDGSQGIRVRSRSNYVV